jgi:hypothetical protein
MYIINTKYYSKDDLTIYIMYTTATRAHVLMTETSKCSQGASKDPFVTCVCSETDQST